MDHPGCREHYGRSIRMEVFGGQEPVQRRPDPAVEIMDPSAAEYRLALTSVDQLCLSRLNTVAELVWSWRSAF